MNFRKRKLYSFYEISRLIVYSLCNRIVDRIPKGLRNTHDIVGLLNSTGTEVSRKQDAVFFNHIINEKACFIQLKKNSSDPFVFQQIILNNEYGIIVDLFKNNNIPMANVVDAGANIGLTSIYLKAYFPDASIIALEPSANTFNRLSINIESNKLKNVTCLQKGLWSRSAFLSSDTTFRDGMDWAFRLIESTENKKGAFAVVSITDLIKEYKIGIIDLLKIDIEGGEVAVFDKNADLSWLSLVKVIAIEIHDEFNCRAEIENKLLKSGFSIDYSGELTIGVNNNLIKHPVKMESVKAMGAKAQHVVPAVNDTSGTR